MEKRRRHTTTIRQRLFCVPARGRQNEPVKLFPYHNMTFQKFARKIAVGLRAAKISASLLQKNDNQSSRVKNLEFNGLSEEERRQGGLHIPMRKMYKTTRSLKVQDPVCSHWQKSYKTYPPPRSLEKKRSRNVFNKMFQTAYILHKADSPENLELDSLPKE